jgi:tetratricopeptide (TPR) repeat protein
MTRSDDVNAPTAADIVERAAQLEPTAARWLLVADQADTRNRRLAAITHAQTLAPDDPFVLLAIGHERRVGAHAEDALPFLDRAIAADDAFVLPRVERALILDGIGLSLAAYHEASEALDRDPLAPAILRACASFADRAQLYDEAQSLRQRYLRVNADPTVFEALAREARSRGDRDAARAMVDRMLSMQPDRLSLYTSSADILEGIGRGEEALAVLQRGLEIAPDEASLWRSRGELEVRLGRNEEARASMRRALALSPQDRTVRQHAEALEPPVPRPDEALAEAPEVFLARRANDAAAAGGYKYRGLQDLTVRTVYPNGLAGAFHQTVMQVLTEEGAESARQYPIQFEPSAQRFELRSARVYHPNGEVDESATTDEYSLTAGPSRMYFDNREVVVSFPHLRPGDVIELRWRVDDVSQRNAFANYFGDLALLQSDHPRAHVRYVLQAPADRQLYFHIPQLPRLNRVDRTEGGNHIYDFTVTDVAPVAPEDHAPGWTERAAYIHVSTYRTWEDVGHWYWGLISDQLQADDRVRNIVHEITRGLTTERDKVRAIYDWVIQNTRYVALEFGIHGFLPYRVPEVCARGFGDCKDKASTIVSMLREVGIDASIVLVRTRHNGDVDTTPASLAVFDHAIAYVPPFGEYPEGLFLDGTAQGSGMDELPSGDQGAMALIVNQRGEARLTHIPVYAAERNVVTSRNEIVVDSSGSATFRASQDLQGPAAGSLRGMFDTQATRAERLERTLGAMYAGIRVSEVRTNDLGQVERPAHLEYDATVPAYATRQGQSLLFAPTSPLSLTRQLAQRSTRTSDVMIGSTMTTDETRTIHLPSGAQFVDVPENVTVNSPLISMELTYQRQPGVLIAHRVIRTQVDRVPAAQYTAFRDICQRIDDAVNRRVTVRLP